MADETKTGIGNLLGGNKPADDSSPTDATASSGAGDTGSEDTQPGSGDSVSADANVSEKLNAQEKRNTQGEGGPNRAPTFGKHGYQDENHPILDPATLASIKDGANSQSAAAIRAAESGNDTRAAVEGSFVGAEPPEGEETVQYTSRIARLGIGRFRFEGGVLTLRAKPQNDDDNYHAEAFENLLRQVSPRTRNAIRKIERGEGVFARPLNLGGRMTRGADTSTRNTRAPAPSDSQ